MFDMEGGERLEKVVAKDSTKMFLDNCKGNFEVVYFKNGSCRVNGKLIISRIESNKLYVNIKDFHGKLIIENCPKLETLEGSFLEKIAIFDGNITINQCPSLVSVKGLPGLIKGDLSITNCKKLKNCEGIDTVFGNVYWQNNGKKYTADQLKEKTHVIKKIFCGGEDIEANVEEGLISEALNNPWLQRLAAQLKKYPYKEHSWLDDEPDKYNKIDTLFSLGNNSSTHGRLLDKITSDDIDVYDMSDEKDKKNLAKAFWNTYNARDAKAGDVVLIYDDELEEFIGGFGYQCRPRGAQNMGIRWIEIPHKGSYSNKLQGGTIYTKTEAKTKLLDYGDGYTVVIINSGVTTGTDSNARYNIKRDRDQARIGMINPGDEEQYKKIAADNIKRYKDLVAQIRMNRKKTDTEGYDKIIDEYEKINVRIVKLTRMITKDPKTFEKYKVSSFFEWVRNKKEYNKNYKPWKKDSGPEYYGSNGLNYVFQNFIDCYMACFGSGHYKSNPDEYDYKSLERATAAMKQILELADKKLKDLGV